MFAVLRMHEVDEFAVQQLVLRVSGNAQCHGIKINHAVVLQYDDAFLGGFHEEAVALFAFQKFLFGLFAGEGFPDVIGNFFKGLDQFQREVIFVLAVQLEKSDNFLFFADGDQGDGGIAEVNAIVAGIQAGILRRRQFQKRK